MVEAPDLRSSRSGPRSAAVRALLAAALLSSCQVGEGGGRFYVVATREGIVLTVAWQDGPQDCEDYARFLTVTDDGADTEYTCARLSHRPNRGSLWPPQDRSDEGATP